MQTLEVHQENNTAVVHMRRGKANPMNAQMLKELGQAFAELRDDDSVKSVILTGQPGYFSAGLDVKELVTLDEKGMLSFWKDFFEMMRVTVAFPKPLISAINGHSPAGGCVLAICSDFRYMVDGEGRIGLNEIPVGIIVPSCIHKLMGFWVGEGKASQLLLQGALLSPKEALQCNLVDQLTSAEDLMEIAQKKAKQLNALPPKTLARSKLNFRDQLIAEFEKPFEVVLGPMLSSFQEDEFKAAMAKVVASLGA